MYERSLHICGHSTFFDDVLGSDVAHEDSAAIAVLKARAKDLFGEQHSETVVQQHPVAVVREMSLRRVEPLMQGDVIVGRAAPLLRGAFGVNERVAHANESSS